MNLKKYFFCITGMIAMACANARCFLVKSQRSVSQKTKKSGTNTGGNMRWLVLWVMALALWTTGVYAKTIEVSRPGTIQAAIDNAEAGDTIIVQPGKYEESVSITKPVTLKAAVAGRTVIGKYMELPKQFVLQNGVWSVDCPQRIYGLYEDNGAYPYIHPSFFSADSISRVKEQPGSFFYDENAKKLYLNHEQPQENFNEHVFGAALLPYGIRIAETTDVTVEGIRLEYCGISIGKTKNVSLRNCTAGHVSFDIAVQIAFSENVSLDGCVFFDSMQGLYLGVSKNVTVSHCTVYRTRSHGIILSNLDGLALTNNIVYASGASGCIYYIQTIQNSQVDFNDVVSYAYPEKGFKVFFNGTRYEDFAAYQKASGLDAHSLCKDPEFISEVYGQEDFSLKPASPCLKAGNDKRNLGAY